jgi:hypothetical protein
LLSSGATESAETAPNLIHLSDLDLAASLKSFYGSADLWLGVLAAALLLAAVIWVRRYRDETT